MQTFFFFAFFFTFAFLGLFLGSKVAFFFLFALVAHVGDLGLGVFVPKKLRALSQRLFSEP